MELLISKNLYEIPIPLFQLRKLHKGVSCVHESMEPASWCFFSTKETRNGVGKDAVAVICLNSCGREEVVGHTPQNISKVVPLYLSLFHIVTWNLKSLENMWKVVVVMDWKFRQGFVFMGLKSSLSGWKRD